MFRSFAGVLSQLHTPGMPAGVGHARRFVVAALTLFLFAGTLWASEGSAHSDPSGQIVLWLAVILVSAQLGGDLAARVGQPAVLGELLIGVILGNVNLAGVTWRM